MVFPIVAGNIDVMLPDDAAKTKTTASMTYTGVYRNGDTSLFSFEYEDMCGAGHQSAPVLTFKGMDIKSHQTITFNVTTRSSTDIQGVYKTENPGDNGTFSLQVAAPL
jgi:hypothetical protein